MGPETRSKVARLIDEYSLTEFGRELESMWLGRGRERESLRSLADRFNQTLLLSALRDAGMDVIDGEAQNYYRLLTDDDVTAGKRVEARNRLAQNGVDIDQITEEFVTYQAIRHYLTEVREVSYEGAEKTEQVDHQRSVIDRLQSRVETVVRDTVDRMSNTEALSIGSYRVFVSVDILCQDCGGQFSIGSLLARGGCNCDGH